MESIFAYPLTPSNQQQEKLQQILTKQDGTAGHHAAMIQLSKKKMQPININVLFNISTGHQISARRENLTVKDHTLENLYGKPALLMMKSYLTVLPMSKR